MGIGKCAMGYHFAVKSTYESRIVACLVLNIVAIMTFKVVGEGINVEGIITVKHNHSKNDFKLVLLFPFPTHGSKIKIGAKIPGNVPPQLSLIVEGVCCSI